MQIKIHLRKFRCIPERFKGTEKGVREGFSKQAGAPNQSYANRHAQPAPVWGNSFLHQSGRGAKRFGDLCLGWIFMMHHLGCRQYFADLNYTVQ